MPCRRLVLTRDVQLDPCCGRKIELFDSHQHICRCLCQSVCLGRRDAEFLHQRVATEAHRGRQLLQGQVLSTPQSLDCFRQTSGHVLTQKLKERIAVSGKSHLHADSVCQLPCYLLCRALKLSELSRRRIFPLSEKVAPLLLKF